MVHITIMHWIYSLIGPMLSLMKDIATMNQALHVVFGAGQVGSRLAAELAARGARVRIVRRSEKPLAIAGVELVVGDACDPSFALRAAEGASVVYHCMNPSTYRAGAWESELPRFGEALIAAAVQSRARLVVLDNLYAYGPTEGRRDEGTRMVARGRKGSARARWTARLVDARQERGLRYVVGKAGDFFGEGADQALVSPAAVRGMRSGKRPITLGDPDAPHAFSYVGDVVAGLAALGTSPDSVEGKVFHLPVHEIAPRELFAQLGRELDVEVAPRRIGRAVLTVLSPFVPLFRELLETLYQWDRPFLVDDERFRATFPGVGVSLAAAVRATARAAIAEAGATG